MFVPRSGHPSEVTVRWNGIFSVSRAATMRSVTIPTETPTISQRFRRDIRVRGADTTGR